MRRKKQMKREIDVEFDDLEWLYSENIYFSETVLSIIDGFIKSIL